MNTLLCSLVMVGSVFLTGTTVSAVDSSGVEVVETVEATQAVAETSQAEPTEEIEAVSAATVDTADLQPISLTKEDCVKCHYKVAVDIDTNGQAHKELSCMECQEEHPPAGTNTIPECSACHTEDDNAHFAVQQCTACHNPHHPLLVDFTASEAAKPVCSSCHQEQIDELTANPSAHSEQDCNACHTKHGLEQGQYQNCLNCHEGHSPEMNLGNCLECHKPHSPTNITFGDTVSVELCAGCHEDVAASLKALLTKHSEMACVDCHGGEHKTITACADCHELPHNEFMHAKFPECITCHRDPHNLAR